MNLKSLCAATVVLLAATAQVAVAQPQPDQPPPPEQPDQPPPDQPDQPDQPDLPDQPPPDDTTVPAEPPAPGNTTRLTLHIINTRNQYATLKFDIFEIVTQEVVATGESADESAGEPAATFELPVGTYKIVKAGEPFSTRVDFATVQLTEPTDYVIVVDAQTGAFRGGGVVVGELPRGKEIAGIRVALNVGGSLEFTQTANVVGNTNGINALVSLFGNFNLVFERGNHFLQLDSQLAVTVRDPETADAFSTSDLFKGSALYAYNLNNPYVGPYVRGSFQTKVFPGYLYLEHDQDVGVVNVNRLDGTVDTFEFGTEANPDDLRIQLADALSPFILQQELGGNLKAVDLDLKLLQVNVATRVGFGFREGIANGLLVVEGDERGSPVELFEVDDYFTLGPVVGANATVTFARWLFGSGEFGMMVPVKDTDEAGSSFARRLLIDLSATGGLKFPSLSFFYGSIDYTLRLQRDGYLTDDTQFAHTVMARANLQLF